MITTDHSIINTSLQGRVLVVDNDNTICEMIRSHFGPDGFVVDSCSELDDLYSIELTDYQLIIIDLSSDEDRKSVV